MALKAFMNGLYIDNNDVLIQNCTEQRMYQWIVVTDVYLALYDINYSFEIVIIQATDESLLRI